MHNDYLILTNNPLVLKKLDGRRNVIYKKISYEDILKEVRDRVHEGYTLLTHPLSGSVKPNETPYKSVMMGAKKGNVDPEALRIIEFAISSCEKFQVKYDKYHEDVYEDFQVIDWTLLESALPSADVCRY